MLSCGSAEGVLDLGLGQCEDLPSILMEGIGMIFYEDLLEEMGLYSLLSAM